MATFSKRHYEAIAKAMREAHVARDDEIEAGWLRDAGEANIVLCDTIEILADMFGADNPRFDRGRFVKACGY
jgi:hypothetical protein